MPGQFPQGGTGRPAPGKVAGILELVMAADAMLSSSRRYPRGRWRAPRRPNRGIGRTRRSRLTS